eukprot:4456942-Pleurochrysis_carterae.AAC.1
MQGGEAHLRHGAGRAPVATLFVSVAPAMGFHTVLNGPLRLHRPTRTQWRRPATHHRMLCR